MCHDDILLKNHIHIKESLDGNSILLLLFITLTNYFYLR